jgi:1-acyl-sn-glycerol-3-phosphate acyltransferase
VLRRAVDWMLAWVARLATRMAFRSVEVEGFGSVPRGTPVLVVANHFNGFVDPVVVVAALRRLPRFLAKATLWKVWVVRPLLALAGLVAVERPEDGKGVDGNTRAFARAEQALGRGGVVAIFPEGTTHDEPRLVRVRTGAARIALGAHEAGVRGLRILPVGLTFEDKLALRSRVLVRAGTPIDLDVILAAGGASPDDRAAVDSLTEAIAAALRSVAPDYDSRREHGACSAAADVALRTDAAKAPAVVPLASREALARSLAAAPAPVRGGVVDALAGYVLDLDLADVTDEQLMPPPSIRRVLLRLFTTAVQVVVLSVFALIGLIVNLVPATLVAVAGAAVREPVTKGTVRLLVGLVVFPVAWIVFALTDELDGWVDAIIVLVLSPVCGLAAVYLVDKVRVLWDAFRAWRVVTNRRARLDDLLATRAALVARVRAATT